MTPSLFRKDRQTIDWITTLLYVLLVFLGWLTIVGASYDFSQASLLQAGSRPMMQLVWIGCSLLFILIILKLDLGFIESSAPLLYMALIGLLIVTVFVAPDIKGSRSWLVIGPIRLQPAEFAKLGTALMLAHWFNRYNFILKDLKSHAQIFGIILLPIGIIFMQSEAGSALVFSSFFLALYREGFSGIFLGLAALAIILFVSVLSLSGTMWGNSHADLTIMSLIIIVAMLTLLAVYTKRNRYFVRLCGALSTLATLFYIVNSYYPLFDFAYVALPLLGAIILYCLYRAIRLYSSRFLLIALLGLGLVGYSLSVEYVYSHILMPHQKMRIAVALGLEDDIRGVGYNVNQAKIAIGSGGLTGKGFLEGTQTKLKYVPEQDTDFIFCTMGEEQGFIGSVLLLLLYLTLILRIMWLAEKQTSPFGRVYGNSIACIFLFHLMVNVGMVLGIVPVIGIPLPFFSYGGSSLWSFTIMLFLFLRIDAGRKR